MKFIINRDAIRPLDVGFTCDVSLFSFVEKSVINGLGRAITDWPPSLPAHVFLFAEIYGHLKILEMVQDNNDHKRAKLTLTSIEKYEDNGPFGDRIVCIKRNAFYDDPARLRIANDRHIKRWADGNTLYDYTELSFFTLWAKLFKLKNDPNKLVCSSEIESELNKDGYTYTTFPLEAAPQGVISPWDIMVATSLMNHKGNRFDFKPLENIYKKT
jgi:hypothetical protein